MDTSRSGSRTGSSRPPSIRSYPLSFKQKQSLDPIYRHPTTGGIVFVGRKVAATNNEILTKCGIKAVICCTEEGINYTTYQNIKYFHFPVAFWRARCGLKTAITDASNDAACLAQLRLFLDPMLKFIEDNLCEGGSVLIHCLAGAHRAGTTGIIALMHFRGIGVKEAVSAAKSCRLIIQPIGDFPQLLRLFNKLSTSSLNNDNNKEYDCQPSSNSSIESSVPSSSSEPSLSSLKICNQETNSEKSEESNFQLPPSSSIQSALSSSSSEQSSSSPIDYNKEAAKLWISLGLNPSDLDDPLLSNRISSKHKHCLDPIYKHPTTGGTIFVGRKSAATNIEVLTKCGVTAVMCCTEEGVNYHMHSSIKYFHFPVATWKLMCGLKSTWGPPSIKDGTCHRQLRLFLGPMLKFLEDNLSDSGSVLIHCLAGAHRAGTTGIIALMHLRGIGVKEAVGAAKSCRSVIEPIGDFPYLLKLCGKLSRKQDGKFAIY